MLAPEPWPCSCTHSLIRAGEVATCAPGRTYGSRSSRTRTLDSEGSPMGRSRNRWLLVVVGCVATVLALSGCDWLQYRYDSASGFSPDVSINSSTRPLFTRYGTDQVLPIGLARLPWRMAPFRVWNCQPWRHSSVGAGREDWCNALVLQILAQSRPAGRRSCGHQGWTSVADTLGLFALDADTGRKLWSTSEVSSPEPPIIDGDRVGSKR